MMYRFRRKSAIDNGFKILGNIEPRAIFHSPGEEQWVTNYGQRPFLRDLGDFKNVEVIIGHPDCGSGSVLRLSRSKKLGDFSKNPSLNLYFKAVNKYKPKIFLLENLPALLDQLPPDKLTEIMPGYGLIINVSSVSNYGNSQVSRIRAVIIGIREDLYDSWSPYFKKPPYNDSKLKTSEFFELGEEEIPSLCHVREPDTMVVSMPWKGKKLSYAETREIWNTELAGSKKWPVGGKMGCLPGVNRNLPGIHPLTVRKQNRQYTSKGYVLSPREMLSIQGGPESFKLVFHEDRRIYWINKGRATATKTGPYEIGMYLYNSLIKIKKAYEI